LNGADSGLVFFIQTQMDLLLGFCIGLSLGAGLLYYFLNRALGKAQQQLAGLKAQREAELRAADEKLQLLEQARAQLESSFKALSAEALSKNNADFLNLARATLEKYQEGAKGDLDKRQQSIQRTVEPVNEALRLFNQRIEKIEDRRTATDASLKQQLEQLSQAQAELSRTTGSLVQALRAPQVRGQWGEMHLLLWTPEQLRDSGFEDVPPVVETCPVAIFLNSTSTLPPPSRISTRTAADCLPLPAPGAVPAVPAASPPAPRGVHSP